MDLKISQQSQFFRYCKTGFRLHKHIQKISDTSNHQLYRIFANLNVEMDWPFSITVKYFYISISILLYETEARVSSNTFISIKENICRHENVTLYGIKYRNNNNSNHRLRPPSRLGARYPLHWRWSIWLAEPMAFHQQPNNNERVFPRTPFHSWL